MEDLQNEVEKINADLAQFDATFNFKGKTQKELEDELVLARQIHEMYFPK